MEEAKLTQTKTATAALTEKYTVKDTHIVENPHAYSTLGKVPVSVIPSQPIWSFGKATRKDSEKVGSTQAISKVQFMGKASPGPIYDPKSAITESKSPAWRFPDLERLGPTAPLYDHYEIIDQASDPSKAKSLTDGSCPTTMFGSGGRVSSSVRPKRCFQPCHRSGHTRQSECGPQPSRRQPPIRFSSKREGLWDCICPQHGRQLPDSEPRGILIR